LPWSTFGGFVPDFSLSKARGSAMGRVLGTEGTGGVGAVGGVSISRRVGWLAVGEVSTVGVGVVIEIGVR
jgi:hypothetical protein